jgi:anti-sigma factor RsiW
MTQKRAASIVQDIVTKDDLHAFVDGALSPSRHAEISAYIRDHDDAAAMVDEIRRLNELLHQRSGGTTESPVPDRLTRLVQELAEAIDRRSQAR